MVSAIVALVALLMLVGVVGSFLPFVPGTPLIVAAAMIYAVATDFQPVGYAHLLVLVGLSALAYLLEYASSALGTKKLGGSRWAMGGAIVGGIAGLFFGPLGILLGPIVGAVAFELLHRQDVRIALKSGAGAVVGVLLGVVAKLAISVVMVGLFTFWVWRA